MKLQLVLLIAAAVATNAVDLLHRGSDDKRDKGTPEAEEGDVVECEGFDALALCPGGWPMVPVDEATHRVKCCGVADSGKCALCHRCVEGSFVDGCCDCDDAGLVDNFWAAMHEFHSGIHEDGTVIGERQLINLIAKVKGDMDTAEELKVKEVYSGIMEHVVPDDAKTTSGLAPTDVVSRYLRENPEVVDHLLGETESPAEGEHQLELDHTKAVTPEWHGASGAWGSHLPPPIVRRTGNGLWEAMTPNFAHPENGYLPPKYFHSNQEARSYVASQKAAALTMEATKKSMQENIQNKAAENSDLLNEKTKGYTKGHHMTHQQKAAALSFLEMGSGDGSGSGADLEAAAALAGGAGAAPDAAGSAGGEGNADPVTNADLEDVAAAVDAAATAVDGQTGSVKRITSTHVESTDVSIERRGGAGAPAAGSGSA